MIERVTLFRLSEAFRQSVVASSVTLLCILGVGILQVPQLHKIISSQKTASSEKLQREIRSEQLRLSLMRQLPTFGFDNLTADWVFLNFLQYFGDDQVREKTGYGLSPDYFAVIVARDPRFLAAYSFLSTSTSIYAARPELSVALMAKGLKSLSPTVPQRSYYIWRYKGIDELLFLGDAKAAKYSFEMAAKWASFYPDEESKQVEALSQGTAKFLAHNPKSKSAQIAAWVMVLNNQVDDRTREIAITRIKALGGKVFITTQGAAQVQLPKGD